MRAMVANDPGRQPVERVLLTLNTPLPLACQLPAMLPTVGAATLRAAWLMLMALQLTTADLYTGHACAVRKRHRAADSDVHPDRP